LEAQLNDRELLDLGASDKAQAQIVEEGARRLTDQKFQAEIQLQNLTLMLADSQHRLAGLQNLYTDDYPDVKAQKVRIAGLEDSMTVLERQLAQDNTSQAQVNKRLTELQSQIRAMQEKHRELELLNEEMATKRLAELQRQLIVSKQALTNWTVKSIDIVGLSGEARDALLANLPVKLGSKLAEGSVDAIAAALKKFDEHLTFTVTLSGSGEAVIHIARPKI
jgi:chromosome segregation ATPase